MAGLVAGVLAGLFAVLVASGPMDAAIALENAAAEGVAGDGVDALARSTQRLGLVVGTSIFGAAMGVAFGVAAAFARGRLTGDAWRRSLVLGAAAVLAVVVLPALAYPPNPPAVGDPSTVGLRSGSYLAIGAVGVAVLLAAWLLQRWLVDRHVATPTAQFAAILAGVSLVALMLFVRPDLGGAGDYPGELLWRFRLSSIGTQVVLWTGLGVVHGWLSSRAEGALTPPPRTAHHMG